MHPLALPFPLAGIMGLGIPELMIIFVAVLGVIFALPIAIIAIAFSFKHRQQKLWHESARLALEKGQPLPIPPGTLLANPDPGAGGRNDIRTGLILVAVGVGLAVFFKGVGAREAMGIGAIPLCIGVALLLYGLFSVKKSSAKDQPPRT